MTALEQLLDVLPLANRKTPSPGESNYQLHPAVVPGTTPQGLLGPAARANAVPAATVKHGELKHPDGGPAKGAPLPVRVVAVLGPGATFAGLAAALLPLYTGATPAGVTPLKSDELARGLVGYNKDLLPASDWSRYRVGLCVQLPIEVDGTGSWTLNVEKTRGWAALFPSDRGGRLKKAPPALDVPEPAVIEGEARAMRTAPGAPAKQWERTLRNPSEAVLTLFAILRQIQDASTATGPDDALRFALAFLDNAQAHHVALLATMRAGNGILRRVATALDRPAPGGVDPARLTAAKALVDNALFTGTGAARKPVDHREVPETADLLAVRPAPAKPVAGTTSDPAGGLHRLVLGRDVAVGRSTSATVGRITYTGPAFAGRLRLDPFLKDDAAALADPVVVGALELRALGRNPGSPFDAVKARDAGVLAVGLESWSALDRAGALDPTGLAAVLSRFKDIAPDEFDLFFKLHGLDVEQVPGDPTKGRLKKVGADGRSSTVMSADEVRTLLGGTGDPTKAVTYDPVWAARFRLPALVSRRYRRAQVLVAVDKVKRTADPVDLAIASVSPFPSPYALAFDGPRSVTLKTAVNTAVGPFLTAEQAAGTLSADTLSGAIVDLTAGPLLAPAYASSHGTDDEDTFYVGSMNKVAALYAALELRLRLRKALDAAKAKGMDVTGANWHVPFVDKVRRTWSARVARGFTGFETTMPKRFPKLTDMFSFTAGGTVDFTKGTATDPEIVALNLNRPDPVKMRFLELLKSMIFMSNPIATGRVIDALDFPYLNGVLREGGFFEPRSDTGIWVSGNYASNDWTDHDAKKLSPRGKRHYKTDTNFVGNAKQFARLLTLAARNELFDKDAASCGQMLTIMLKNNDPRIDNSFNQDAVDNTPEGVGARPVGAPPLKVDKVSSKIGIGLPARANGPQGAHDCALIERKKGATTLRYVVVIVGGFTGGDGGAYDELVQRMDGALAGLH